MPKRKSSQSRSHSTSRNLIVRTCSGNPVAVVFLNQTELHALRFDLAPVLDKSLTRIYQGIKPEAEIEIESEAKR